MKALLLLNMGGPRDISEVEIFLKNMFNDPYILGIKSGILRKFIAFMITRARLKAAQSNYAQIGGKSPICELTQRLCDKITAIQEGLNLAADLKFDAIDYAMNYTPPFTKDVLARYADYDEIVVLPLYPHHSHTTVTSSLADFECAKDQLDLKAKVRVIEPFYKEADYNAAIVADIVQRAAGLELGEIELIFSAHSLPQKMIDAGDVYERHITEHVEILRELLKREGLKFKAVRLAYQSRLGPVKWLEPALGDVLAQVESKRALIYPIAFCVDNSETIFELVKEYKHVADRLNFSFYDVVPCLNDSDGFAKFILKAAKE